MSGIGLLITGFVVGAYLGVVVTLWFSKRAVDEAFADGTIMRTKQKGRDL